MNKNFPPLIISKHLKFLKLLGELNLFSVPVVILFYEGREIHRQAKIIDFKELNYRMETNTQKINQS